MLRFFIKWVHNSRQHLQSYQFLILHIHCNTCHTPLNSLCDLYSVYISIFQANSQLRLFSNTLIRSFKLPSNFLLYAQYEDGISILFLLAVIKASFHLAAVRHFAFRFNIWKSTGQCKNTKKKQIAKIYKVSTG